MKVTQTATAVKFPAKPVKPFSEHGATFNEVFKGTNFAKLPADCDDCSGDCCDETSEAESSLYFCKDVFSNISSLIGIMDTILIPGISLEATTRLRGLFRELHSQVEDGNKAIDFAFES